MKKIHAKLYEIECKCLSCSATYKITSVTSQNISIEICANCNPFYTKESFRELRIGQVEKYRQRNEKTTSIKTNKN